MNVTVKLYQNYSDPNVVYKNISLVSTNTCLLTNGCSIDAPEILLDMQSSIETFNYMYIPEFKRYYHATAQIVNGNHMLISGYTDVLMSFWNNFRGSQCVAQRSTSHQNPDIEDEMLPFKGQPKYIYRRSSFAFTPSASGGCYILTVGGK